MTKALAIKIRKALMKSYPQANSIEQNQWGNWEVTCDDGYEEQIYTFAYDGDKFRYLGLIRVEI